MVLEYTWSNFIVLFDFFGAWQFLVTIHLQWMEKSSVNTLSRS